MSIPLTLPGLPRWLGQAGGNTMPSFEDHLLDEKQEAQHEILYEHPLRCPTEGLPGPPITRLGRIDVAGHLSSLINTIKPSALAQQKTTRKLHATSYLDGLRGTAALFVFFHHTTLSFYTAIRPGYGIVGNTNLLSLPIIRVWFSGGSMVSVFFVISGYVLSHKALRLARLKRPVDVYQCIGSAAFRRGPRLYIPCIVVTFVIAIAVQMGVMDPNAHRSYPISTSLWAQMQMWFSGLAWFISPFGGEHWCEPNTWTIPVEFKGSLLVFLTCLGLAESSSRIRLVFITSMALFWLYHGWAELFLFSAGMFCADVSFLHARPLTTSAPTTTGITIIAAPTHNVEAGISPGAPPTHSRARRSCWSRLLPPLLILFSLHVLSMPQNDEGLEITPGFITLAGPLTPAAWHGHPPASSWWPSLGAVILVLTLDHAGPDSIFQRVFTSRFAQYLGEISYSLYLLHSALLYSLGTRLVRFGCALLEVDPGTGKAGGGGWNYLVVLAAAGTVMVPVLFWMSEMLSGVDRAAVRLAKWMRGL